MVWLISGPCGTAVVFLAAFFCTRVSLGLSAVRSSCFRFGVKDCCKCFFPLDPETRQAKTNSSVTIRKSQKTRHYPCNVD